MHLELLVRSSCAIWTIYWSWNVCADCLGFNVCYVATLTQSDPPQCTWSHVYMYSPHQLMQRGLGTD